MPVADSSTGQLRYRGVVEIGLAREELREALAAPEEPACPLAWDRPPCGVTRVTPSLDVEVSCHGRNGALREATGSS